MSTKNYHQSDQTNGSFSWHAPRRSYMATQRACTWMHVIACVYLSIVQTRVPEQTQTPPRWAEQTLTAKKSIEHMCPQLKKTEVIHRSFVYVFTWSFGVIWGHSGSFGSFASMRVQKRSLVTIDTHARSIHKNIHWQHIQATHYHKDTAPYDVPKTRRSEHYIILKGGRKHGF